MARPLLITISFSHFCEKARWALQRSGVEFDEEAHLPVFHFRATKARGSRSTPVLVVSADQVLTQSREIVRWADAERGSSVTTLFPAGQEAELERWRARFDDVLGPHSRRWAYRQLFDQPRTMNALFAPRLGRLGARMSGPVFRAILGRAMNVTHKGAARSHALVSEIFDEVGDALTDRPFLLGDQFTAADLGFAALAAPLVLPDGYGGPFPTAEDLGAEAQVAVEKFRAHPAGQHVAKLYAAFR